MILFLDETDLETKNVGSIKLKESDISFDELFYSFGGFYSPREQITTILELFRNIKKKYIGFEEIPLKNNYKDYKSFYNKTAPETYEKLKNNFSDIRIELFKELSKLNVKSIICIKYVYRNDKDYFALPFINVIQRFAMEIKHSSFNGTPQIIMDWVQRKDNQIYRNEYESLFLYGHDSKENHSSAGRLKSLNFYPSLNFSFTFHDALLQITDFIIGSWRYIFKKVHNDRLKDSDYTLLDSLLPLLRGYDEESSHSTDNIFSFGLLLPNESESLQIRKFKKFLSEYIE